MPLSSELISKFAKVTKNDNANKKDNILYGTVHILNDMKYVALDGAAEGVFTPITTTVIVEENDRVSVEIKNHTAVVTGNISNNAARYVDTVNVAQINAANGRIDNLLAANVEIQGTLSAHTASIGTLEVANLNITNRLTISEADIGNLEADNVTIKSRLTATEADIGNLEADNVLIKNRLTASEADIDNLQANSATIANLNAITARIDTLDSEKISTTSADIRYANIDFSNITNSTMANFYANSGLIQNVVIGDSTITGRLVGVTISGDLIEANTLIANKLVILGDDGLYYKINTTGITTEAQQTDYNSLNGTIIKANTITASKINVDDLVAFDATIGGFNITNSSLYSGVKSTVGNTTRGIYLDNDGQIAFGDATNFLKFFKDADNNYKLSITASNITLGANSIETSINNAQTAANNAATSASNANTIATTANNNASAAQSTANTANTNAINAAKTATNFMNLNASDGLVIGDHTVGTLGGNVQIKAETGGASISLRYGTTILSKFIATSKAFTGITNVSTSTTSTNESLIDDVGTTNMTVTAASQSVSNNQNLNIVRVESTNPVYFPGGFRTDGVTVTNTSLISNVNFTLNGRMFDVNGRSAFEPVTGEGNLSIGYGRFRAATSTSTDKTIIYGNEVRLTTKNGATIIQDGSAALETYNSNGNMTLGYHLYRKGTGDVNIYAGDTVHIRGDSIDILDSSSRACFEAKNSSGNTTLGYARYLNGGNTNIYGGEQINLNTEGGVVRTNSTITPATNASLALGTSASLGWSNIYVGNASGVYNGLRIIVGGNNLNLCGINESGRSIFGNPSAIMYYRAKDVNTTNPGEAFKFTSGNDGAAFNSISTWLYGGADSISRYVGSYIAYNRTYTAAANMHVTQNGVFGRSTSSSSRYKRDIELAPLSELSGLYNLPIKKFKYNNDYIATDDELYDCCLYGFIVEDLVSVLPCAVEHIDDGEGNLVPEMWNINIMVPAMMKLIQDLNTRIQALET